MIKEKLDNDILKSSVPPNVEVKLLGGAAGDLYNDKVKMCYTCRNRGYQHEAITFEKVNGRMLTNGTYEVAGWKLRNYFDGQEHEHKAKGVNRK